MLSLSYCDSLTCQFCRQCKVNENSDQSQAKQSTMLSIGTLPLLLINLTFSVSGLMTYFLSPPSVWRRI